MQSTRGLESREDVDPRGTSHNGGVIGFSDINSGLARLEATCCSTTGTSFIDTMVECGYVEARSSNVIDKILF